MIDGFAQTAYVSDGQANQALGVQFFFLNDETVNFQHPVVNNADCSDSKAMTVGFEPAALMPSTFPMS